MRQARTRRVQFSLSFYVVMLRGSEHRVRDRQPFTEDEKIYLPLESRI
jgi:hypothetical protein